ncbi:MAG: hypothetical protein NC094_00835 [Bacteroidales bacterium]|nr:hypothetical protein [Lachnoclostridium sp.]MCM1383007.1 hypothetical protein [Lachnoclostridium sp.]MCM1463939.1 hypothetical protein [Bacteroidales bacterium]
MNHFDGKNNRPPWMEDELVRNIPKEKLDFLGRLFIEGHGKSQKEMMAYLMPMMARAKKENLSFTPQEMTAAIAAIRKYSTQEELSQIDNILSKTRNNQ